MSDSHLFSLNIPDTDKPRIVVIGGGFGGINLIRNLPDDFQVVLIDRYNYHTFQPLLYQVATAGLEPDSIAGPLRKIINRKKNLYFRMLRVNSVSPDKKMITTRVGSLKYDILVIASGAKMNFFNNKSIAENAFPLKQITHALDLRSHLFQQFEKLELMQREEMKENHFTFVVVGGGPTGVEICGALAELKSVVLPKDYPDLEIEKVKIYLIEGQDRVLAGMSESSSRRAQRYLEKLGVSLILNCMTEHYDGEVVKLNNGKEIKTDTLIWAAGVKGNIINGFGKESIYKGKLRVNNENQVIYNSENHQFYNEIFAIGDVAHMETKGYPDGLPGLAQVAIQQGKHLAVNLKRLYKNKTLKPFHYFNKGVMATIGRNRAVADLPGNTKLSGFIGWMVWMVVHLLFLIGFRNKVIALANWIWNYITYDRGIRLILRPSTKEKGIMSHDMKEEMIES